MLEENQKYKLLALARESIGMYLKEGKKIDVNIGDDEFLKETRGAFVTLKDKRGNLRGCIGRIKTNQPLYKTIIDMAVESAVGDSRFVSVSLEELENIVIELSVLTEPVLIENIKDIKIGRDGLIIRKGFYSGLLLPQVATEHNWDVIEFLKNTCFKAGLPEDAWKNSEILKFSAEVFSE